MTAEELGEILAYKDICPNAFGGRRRGKWKTCPYPRPNADDCKRCWTEWLGMKARCRDGVVKEHGHEDAENTASS